MPSGAQAARCGAATTTEAYPRRRGPKVTCLVPGFPRQARTDQRESADRIDPALAAEATESTDAAEKTEPIDKIEPAEPTDKMDPLEPIDKIDPLEPMLRMDPSLFRMESFSQGLS